MSSYGTTSTNAGMASPRTAEAEEQSSLLTSEPATVGKDLPDGHASLASSVGNLTNTIIGSGMCICCATLFRHSQSAGMLTFPLVHMLHRAR
jgi:hypothetical protein